MPTDAEKCELRVCLQSLGSTLQSETGVEYLKAHIRTFADEERERFLLAVQLMETCVLIFSDKSNDAILRAAREMAATVGNYNARESSINVSAAQLTTMRDTNDITALQEIARNVFEANTADDTPLFRVFHPFSVSELRGLRKKKESACTAM